MRLSSRNPYRYLLVFSAVILLSLLFGFAKHPTASPAPRSRVVTATVTIIPTMTPELSRTAMTTVLGEASTVFFPVVKVVDGDTLTIVKDGKKETLRLIGINTPETVDPRKGVECFGREASAYAKQLVASASVRLEDDPSQTDRDRYGRLLRYVYLPDGRMVNQVMIEDGYAYEYTYSTKYRYSDTFKTAQMRAQTERKGLWNEGTCKGKL